VSLYDRHHCFPHFTPRIGELLIAQGLISEGELQRALEFQQRLGGRLGAILVRIGSISEDVLLTHLAKQLDLPVFDPQQIPLDAHIVLRNH
jgi:general secretion pathway protein E